MCDGSDDNCQAHCNKGTLEFRRCPNAVLPEEAYRIVMYANLIETGLLPVAGGLEEQAATFMQAMMIVLAKKAELENTDGG